MNLKFLEIIINADNNANTLDFIELGKSIDNRINDADIKIFLIIPDDFYRGLQNSKTAHFISF